MRNFRIRATVLELNIAFNLEKEVVSLLEILTINMYMLKAYLYRINPTDVRQRTLRLLLGFVRIVFNYLLALKQERVVNKKKQLSLSDLSREPVEPKLSEEYSCLYLPHAQSLYQGLKI